MATTKIEYDRFLVEAAHRVLLEVARLLYDYREGLVIVGGSVPGLILAQSLPEHIGTIDVDIALDQNTIQEVGYRSIMQLLSKRGYVQGDQPFIFYRTLQVDGQEITVEVDFLAGEYGGTSKRHRTQVVQDMHPRKARACDLAFQDPIQITIEGILPEGGKDRASIQVASIVPFLMMKAQALNSRLKEKDAYDIYYCVSNFPGGLDALVESFRSFPDHQLIHEGLAILSEKFSSADSVGPVFVTNFLDETDQDSRALIQRDAFERVQYLVNTLRA
jgi:hypothetical protein